MTLAVVHFNLYELALVDKRVQARDIPAQLCLWFGFRLRRTGSNKGEQQCRDSENVLHLEIEYSREPYLQGYSKLAI